MKKRLLALAITAVVAFSVCAVAACSPDASSEDPATDDVAAAGDPQSATEDSLYAYHSALNLDWSSVTTVDAATCAGEAACHGDSWDDVIAKTDALWEGVGQISDANPHSAHASNGFACSDCHSLYGTSVNQCNGCHNFDSPDGWNDKDPTTTVYGVATEEPLPED